MIRISTLFILLIFVSLGLKSQSIENFGRTDRYIGEGKIGNSKIVMTLDFISRVDYAFDGCLSRHYQQIAGSYTYTKYGGSIQLIGQKTNWTYDEDNKNLFVVYELNENFDKTAEFRGTFSQFKFTGIWVNLKNKTELPFQIDFKSSFLGSLSVSFKEEHIQLSGFRYSHQGKYELIDKIEKNDTLYLITKIKEPCCEYYNCRGTNCGGTNEYLYLHILTHNYQKFYKEFISSDCNWREFLNESKGSDFFGGLIESDKEKFLIKIDYNDFEKGIQKIEVE